MKKRSVPYHVRFLQAELERRKKKNPRYSLRAFAKFLEIHPSALSRILANKQELSLQSCTTTIKKLGLSSSDAMIFIAAVAEDKRNRASAILTRSIEPSFADSLEDFEPRFEAIRINPEDGPLTPETVLALTSDYISIMDKKGRFLFGNDPLAKSFDSIPCDLIGLTWNETSYPEEVANELVRQQEQVVATGQLMKFEFTMGSKLRHFQRTIQPIKRKTGKFNSYLSTIRDVSWERDTYNAVLAIHSTIDYKTALARIAHAGLPFLAAGCIVEIRTKSGAYEADAAAHINDVFGDKLLQLARSGGRDFVLSSGADEALQTNSPKTGQLRLPAELNSSGLHSSLAVPISTKAGQIGFLIFVSDQENHAFSPDETFAAARLAEAAGQSLTNAELCAS